ncbi:unnamed protein product [Amoebophrya sp. A25]|nr:unnamed protein product [Amoebophrya sp. A25]|eukprot:GSA25T00005499001.1
MIGATRLFPLTRRGFRRYPRPRARTFFSSTSSTLWSTGGAAVVDEQISSTNASTSSSSSSFSTTSTMEQHHRRRDSVDFLIWRGQLPEKILGSDNYLAPSTISGAGFGVFAGRDYRKGEPVEINPFLRMHDAKTIDTEVDAYKFDDFTYVPEFLPCSSACEDEAMLGDAAGELKSPRKTRNANNHSLIIMGFGSYMNHMEKGYNVDSGYYIKRFALFKALRDIKKDEELFINYGTNYRYTWK